MAIGTPPGVLSSTGELIKKLNAPATALLKTDADLTALIGDVRNFFDGQGMLYDHFIVLGGENGAHQGSALYVRWLTVVQADRWRDRTTSAEIYFCNRADKLLLRINVDTTAVTVGKELMRPEQAYCLIEILKRYSQ
ncbi:MAG TPA: hypothetical protein HA224_02620 [Nanoarchaeota archaeon]|nr:hypothetical protein [Nanoarchaeota archaeon]